MNENAILNVLIDVDFLESEFKRIGRSHLTSVFGELRSVSYPSCLKDITRSNAMLLQTTSIVLSDGVQEYLVPEVRRTSYAAVKNKRLQSLLEKLAKYGAASRDPSLRQKSERRRKEAEAVGSIFPGEFREGR
jgi:hypothetical protein